MVGKTNCQRDLPKSCICVFGVRPSQNTMVTTAAASTTVHIFLPVARLAGHVAASAVGFIALGIIALVPVYLVNFLVWLGGPAQFVELFTWLETAVLYVDIALYGATVLMWSFVFLVEEVRACRDVLGW
jgi:hypothetical protein